MKTIIFTILGVVAGAGAGYAIGSAITKKKYTEIANQQVADVKKALEEYYNEPKEKMEPVIKPGAVKTPEKKTFINKTSLDDTEIKRPKENYVNYSKNYGPSSEVVQPGRSVQPLDDDDYHIITEDEYIQSVNESSTLYWSKDGVLFDDDWNIDHLLQPFVRAHAAEGFGEDDVMYVRNDRFAIDYEILRSMKIYSEDAPQNIAKRNLREFGPDEN